MIDLKIKLTDKNSKLPRKSNDSDACWDIYANLHDLESVAICPGEVCKIDAGFATEIPKGYYASVFPRSGLSIKEGLRLANLTGIIDSGYRNSWVIALYNDSDKVRVVNHGDRIAQFNILPVLDVNMIQVDELDMEKDRGGGIGHTGKQ